MCKEKHMYNHYPEQTKRNVVAVYRAGVRASTISRTLNIPRSTIHTWIGSKEYMDVSPADEAILGHFSIGILLPAKAEKKANGFVKVVGEEPRQRESLVTGHKERFDDGGDKQVDGRRLPDLPDKGHRCWRPLVLTPLRVKSVVSNMQYSELQGVASHTCLAPWARRPA